jgi:3-oxoacyl-[acyl-carrier protein] reductase
MRESIFITGTSFGIGRATAQLFLDDGYHVYGMDVEKSTIINRQYYYHFRTDVRDKAKFPSIRQLSYIVNNAGVQYETQDPIGVNLIGAFNVEDVYVRSNLSSLKAIVNVGSISSHLGLDFRVYTASKGALFSYTKHLANVLGPYGIRVNSLSPGATETELNRAYLASNKIKRLVAKQNLLKRWGQPEELAKAVKFLLCDATFMTGADLLCDGGEVFHNRYIPAEGEQLEYEKR